MTNDQRPRVAFIAAGDPLEVRTWSGTPYHMLAALRERMDVATIVRQPWSGWFPLLRSAVRKLSGRRIDLYWSPFWTRLASRKVRAEIEASDCDLVIGVAITPILVHLIGRKPVFYISDATLAVMADYYPFFKRLLLSLRENARAMETRCIRDADAAFFPSVWAQRSAIRDHEGDPERTYQIEWGANMPGQNPRPPEARPLTPWRLLFVGVGFEGKGGWIAIDALKEVRRRGFDATLDMVGSTPPEPLPEIPGVTFHGFLRKSDPEQKERMETLFREAHLFVLPTAFDAFPTVIAESASYGVPAVSYRTGGLESNVRHGETGLLVEEGAPAEAFADQIVELMTDRARYERMAAAALEFSRERLNWERWAGEVTRIAKAKGF